MNKTFCTALAATSLMLAAGCAGGPSPNTGPGATGWNEPVAASERGVSYGTIRRVELIDTQRSSGAGAVIGGVVGGALGNTVGKGDGRTAATVLGAVGGAIAGNEIEKNRRAGGTVYQYEVQFDRGETRTFSFAADQGYTTGQRVVLVDGVLQQRY